MKKKVKVNMSKFKGNSCLNTKYFVTVRERKARPGRKKVNARVKQRFGAVADSESEFEAVVDK